MFSAKVKSYAKINLSLNIAGTAGGYHLIDSAVCSIDIYDTVCAKPRRDALVNVYMHGRGSEFIPPEKIMRSKRARRSFPRSARAERILRSLRIYPSAQDWAVLPPMRRAF